MITLMFQFRKNSYLQICPLHIYQVQQIEYSSERRDPVSIPQMREEHYNILLWNHLELKIAPSEGQYEMYTPQIEVNSTISWHIV